ncbi:hypothetical protein R6Q57_026831 [Mikania cordata]
MSDEGFSTQEDEYYDREKQRTKKKKEKNKLKRHREAHLTRRRGTKKKQKIDEEDVSDLDVEWFSIVNRCSPKQFVKGVGSLKPKQRKVVENMGFGKLLHFKVNGIPLKIGHYIVDKLDVSTMQILGRQCPVERLGEAGDDDSSNFKVDFLMLFVSTIVECHAHGKCKIDVLNYIGDETDISKINWCSYIVDCIERCKYGWLPNTKSPFKGALAILALLYVDNVQCKGMNVDHTIPPIEFWNMEKL